MTDTVKNKEVNLLPIYISSQSTHKNMENIVGLSIEPIFKIQHTKIKPKPKVKQKDKIKTISKNS